MIWCATGFSSKPTSSPMEKAKGLLDLALKRSIDVTALPNMARHLKKNHEATAAASSFPRVVMLSSAGVTRTVWDSQKKVRTIFINATVNCQLLRNFPFIVVFPLSVLLFDFVFTFLFFPLYKNALKNRHSCRALQIFRLSD